MTSGSNRRRVVLWGLGGGRRGWRSVQESVARTVGASRLALDESLERSAATTAARVLSPDHERRWRWLMRRRARRTLVIASVVTWALPIAGGWSLEPTLPYTGVGLGFLLSVVTYYLLQQASRLIIELPEGYLDERQLQVRDGSFAIAYRVLAGGLATAALAVFIAVAIAAEDVEGAVALPEVGVHLALAAFLSLTMMMQSLPAAVLVWREPDPDLDAPPAAIGPAGDGYPERPDGGDRR